MKKKKKNKLVGMSGIYAREPTKREIELEEMEQEYTGFIYRIKTVKNNRLIVTLLMQETNEHKGMTAYEIDKYLDISHGNVRNVLLELKKYDFVRFKETYYKKRKKHEYFMDKLSKHILIQEIPYIGVDYEEETEFILLCLSEKGLINPKYKLIKNDIKEYSDDKSLAYKIGDTVFHKTKSLGFLYDNFLGEIDEQEKWNVVPYGIAFNAIRDTIAKYYLKDVFESEERIKELGIFPYPRLYTFYKSEEFIRDAESLKNRSEKVIDRMFFRKPKFFPNIKNGGNKS